MRKTPGFGREEIREGAYDKYIGEYVIIYVQGQQTNFSGKVDSIKEGYMILNPFSSGDWDKDKGLTRKLIENKGTSVRVSDISVVEPTTKENIENYLKFNNKRNAKKIKKISKQ